jgi:hypothetical protein
MVFLPTSVKIRQRMGSRSRIKYLLVGVLLIASCSFSGLDFNLATASPQKTYLVKLDPRLWLKSETLNHEV